MLFVYEQYMVLHTPVIHHTALSGVTSEQMQSGYQGDENAQAGKMFIKPGLWIRLTRNLDKSRGFVNGALAQVVDVLSANATGVTVFTAKLSTGTMVLVHPIVIGRKLFLPCTYGYATTIRRAQGSSLHLGAIYFDHSYPPEKGYGYVGTQGSQIDGVIMVHIIGHKLVNQSVGVRAESTLEHHAFAAVMVSFSMGVFAEPIGSLLAFHHQTGNCVALSIRHPTTVLQGCQGDEPRYRPQVGTVVRGGRCLYIHFSCGFDN